MCECNQLNQVHYEENWNPNPKRKIIQTQTEPNYKTDRIWTEPNFKANRTEQNPNLNL